MKQQIGLILCLVSLWGTVQAAEVYRWVDEDGNVQFTQTPPPETAQAIGTQKLPEIRTNKAPAPAPANADTEEAAAMDSEDMEGEELTEAEKIAQLKRENCRKAKENVSNLSSDQAVAVPDPENPEQYKPMSQEARTKALEEAKAYVENFCIEAPVEAETE